MGEKADPTFNVWKWSVDSSNLEKVVDDCGFVMDVDPSGKYLLGVVQSGEKVGIYQVSISQRKCSPLLPGTVTSNPTIAQDGKSFFYSVASRGEVTIYRQPWKDGKIIGAPQVALKVPFAFPRWYAAHAAYDFSRDLSTIVYAHPRGQADLYLLSQKINPSPKTELAKWCITVSRWPGERVLLPFADDPNRQQCRTGQKASSPRLQIYL